MPSLLSGCLRKASCAGSSDITITLALPNQFDSVIFGFDLGFERAEFLIDVLLPLLAQQGERLAQRLPLRWGNNRIFPESLRDVVVNDA